MEQEQGVGVEKIGPYVLGPNDEAENGIYTGDARELVREMPGESVDLIFTDPPYDRASLGLYEWVARAATRVLKPGAFLLAMCGGAYLNRVFAVFDAAGLEFCWLYWFRMCGARTGIVWPHGNTEVPVIVRGKQILAYSKGEGLPRHCTVDLIASTGRDKRYHVWGQSEYSTRYYVDCFSGVGDVVFDPFCGGGTTAAMAKVLGRRWLSFDVDEAAVGVARERVACQPMPFWVPSVVQSEMPLGGVNDRS